MDENGNTEPGNNNIMCKSKRVWPLGELKKAYSSQHINVYSVISPAFLLCYFYYSAETSLMSLSYSGECV